MYEISKDFAFSASHQLHGLPEGHKCGRLHGHSYRVRVTLTSERLDAYGFVLDYGALQSFGDWIGDELDHRHLNDITDYQPSAENLAESLHQVLLQVVPLPAWVNAEVAVSETAKTWARYRP